MVPLWFTLSALCFVGAAVLLYVDLDQRRGRSRRRKSWAKSHGFDFEVESADIVKRWKRGVMSAVGDAPARNVVLGQIRGEAVYIFDLEEVATVIALHRKVATNVVVDVRLKGLKEPREGDVWLLGAIGPRMVYSTNLDAARRVCDRRMVTFAHTAPDCVEVMWNEENWTLVSMPVSSTRAQWEEGLRSVRQYSDLLRVLPPVPRQARAEAAVSAAAGARRNGEPSRPSGSAPAGGDIEGRAQHNTPTPPSKAVTPALGTTAPPAEPRPRRRPATRDEAAAEPVRRANGRPEPGMRHAPAARNGRQTAHHPH